VNCHQRNDNAVAMSFVNLLLDDESADVHADQHEIWTASSRTREASGLGLGQLRIESSEPHGRGRCLYRFSRCDSGPLPSTRIVSGDYVVVSLEWPRRQTGISTGFVHSINNDSVMLSLDTRLAASSNWASQTQQESGRENRLWRLDKDELSTGSGWLRANIARLFTDDQHMRRLRSLLIDLDAPRYGPPSTVHDSDPSLCDKLNAEQARAIDHVLAARDYALILGMPGTGKTTTIARLVQVLARGQKSVLLASFTNAAVDNVLLKLKAHGQDFLRVGNVDSVHQGVVEYTVDGCIGGHTPASLAELYNSAMVVATTCMGTKHDLFRKRRFDYCIVDEASQISQSMCLGPLCCADVFVLVGDHYQLSPLVRSAGAQHKGMSISLFKRLSESHSQAVHQMCSQYRMKESIMNLSSELVYGGQLRCGTPEIASSVLQLPSWPSWSTTDSHSAWIKDVLAPTSPVVFIDTDTISAAEDRSGDALQNVAEAAIVAELVGRLVELGISAQLADMVGIISPYRSQLRVIKAALQRQLQLQGHASSQADRVEVNTVDRYQGRDKDCIILSLVRSNRSQAVGDLLKDWRRINVAITRAKTKMIFVGSASTLRGSAVFDLLITSLARHGRIQSMPAEWLVK
jgi:DNA replication ATP-dependent helicase Dna2